MVLACGPAATGGADSTSAGPAAAPVDDGPPAASSEATGSAPTTNSTGTSTKPAAPPATPPADGPPAKLACLAKYYVGSPTKTAAGAWVLRLPDNTDLVWDDGQSKSFDQKLDQPDLEDTFTFPYSTGAIVPATTLNVDPGRFRSERLFKATYGASSAAVQANLVNVDFVGQTVKFHTKTAAALGKVSAKLQTLVAQTPSLSAYLTGELGGTFSWRPIANTTRMSAHSYGIAIDIVVSKSNYWEWEKKADGSFTWVNGIPQAIVDAFESEGFVWGGRWYHYDTMHFEYRPEMFDPACR